MTVNTALIDQAFASNSSLRKRVYDAIGTLICCSAGLFEDIAQYHLTHQPSNGVNDIEPASKKRKLANGSLPIASNSASAPREVILEARDLSFSLPQRKKLHLGVAQYGTDINAASTKFVIYTRNPASNEVDMEVPLDQFAYALKLPVPEKAAKQYNYVLLPRSDAKDSEPIIWAVNHGPLKSCHISNDTLAKLASDPDTALDAALDFVLKKVGIQLTLPSADEFASAKPESHRKNDQAYHVKAFRGSKDGFLFFLHNGIFFGFKKPLSFFAFEDIVSISYTSVLQRTFNLNIAYGGADDGDAQQEVEFSMLDQADFPGIDAYIKRHGLQDASLAESRRAQKIKAPGAAGKAAVAGDEADSDENDTRTELEKAQQQLEDEEDEEEEDYDPGSDGESEGSGDSDEDDDEEYERERRKLKGKNLVAEELGSEAEDVSVTEEEDEGEREGEGAEGEGKDEDEDEDMEEQEEEVADEEVQEIEQDKQGFEIGQHVRAHGFSAVAPAAHNGMWDGMPDPEDDDQL
ncbi:hypothetical protein PV08_03048 [Exophiala spinifera]|uniref:Histone chaperone RTT106/FACT complex subunit SPT16-like middle domain-containing protein n=1 Tax=Exophiala spinifera TaxID=91928 RepID=A0A0D2C583_9EURO|nr:uncharacterized protein PV08_03048 [Exophiala spinifera]KIW18759.1 hypothetical protein PV08_03048 [Exophiala spinifera]